MNDDAVERFTKIFDQYNDMRISRPEQDAEVYQAREKLMHILVESPEEIIGFYQGAYLRFRDIIDNTENPLPRDVYLATEELDNAYDFHQEFGDFVLKYAAGKKDERFYPMSRLFADVPAEETEAVQGPAIEAPAKDESLRREQESEERPTYRIMDKTTGISWVLPNILTEDVLLVLMKSDEPMNAVKIKNQIINNSGVTDKHFIPKESEINEAID